MRSRTSILTRIVSTVRISSDNEEGDDEKIGQNRPRSPELVAMFLYSSVQLYQENSFSSR